MVEKTANPFRISSGSSRVYTTFAIELKTLGSSRPSCALSRLSRDSSVARTSRADHVIPLIPFQDGWSTLHAVLACPDCKHDTCFAAELKIFAIPRFYNELGLVEFEIVLSVHSQEPTDLQFRLSYAKTRGTRTVQPKPVP
jgi:hypothetical protein